ncbi:MAG: FKBP-type peptidyl-prolyl cis-trans isomerase [Bacteroidota bacterium]
MMRRFHIIISVFVGFSLISCRNKQDTGETRTLNQEQVQERLLEANKTVITAENDQIDTFIALNNWDMNKTGTGLRYQVIEKGKGLKVVTGKFVKFEYEVKLISGEKIYSSTQTGPKEFRVGSGGVESGLEEGMLLLSVGDKARFIIPSYLAHGLSGDQDKIPPKATLIYTVKLIDLQ